MAEPFLGEIKVWGLTFSPKNWAYCDGQLMAVSQFNALFSLLGTQYGGDGIASFGIPNFKGRAPVHPGSNTDVTRAGDMGGAEYVSLSVAQMPSHTHSLNAVAAAATELSPANALPAQSEKNIYADASNLTAMNATSIEDTGGNQAHYNIQPTLALNFCIALQGLYPSRN